MLQGYKEKFIKDLSRGDVMIAVSGVIINKNDNGLVIDDTTGTINVVIETDLGLNKFVKIFGNVIFFDNSKEIQGHVIQDLNDVDKELYQKVKSLLS